MAGVEYQVTKVDPTDPETKGMVYQVHKVTEEVAATLGGKVYRARIIKDPTEPTVAGKVYQIVLIDDPEDPAVKGKVYNAILTGGSEAVVIGPAVSPLALDDAVADTLTYVKAYGGTEQQNLPDGYTQLEYIGGTGTQYIDTGVFGPDVTAFELKGTIATVGGQNTQFIGGTNQAATSFFGARAMSSTITWYCMTAQGSSIGNPSHVCVITSTIESASSQPGTLYDTETGTTTEYAKFASTTWGFGEENILLFGGSETRRSPNATCYYLKLYTANGLAFYGIPVKNSSNAVGLYDLVSGTFFANSGTGDFVAGPTVVPTPDAPMNIVSNNGTIYYSPNMYNKDYEYERIYGFFASTGTTWSYADQGYSIRIACQPNTTYTARYNGNSTQAVLGFGSTSNDNVPASGSSVTVTQCIRQNSPTISTPVTLTTGANDKWLIIAFNVADPQHTDMMDNLQLEKGAVASEYKPYHGVGVYTDGTVETIEDTIGNTATAEMLLSVGDYTDVQEILSGTVTRNVGVLVLDGTEDWTASGNLFYAGIATDALEDTHSCYCTHFKGVATNASASYNNEIKVGTNATQTVNWTRVQTYPVVGTYSNVTAFKQWLADQYAAGTPVIVVYPLATATTESVARQTLQVQDGDNTLEITQASLSGLELEAEYEKEA